MPGAAPASDRLPRNARRGRDWFVVTILASLSLLITVASARVEQTYGLLGLMVFAGVLLAVALLAFVSVRYLEIVVLIWVVTLSGFRNLVVVDMPGLPDVTIDRILLVWVSGVAALRAIMDRPRPFPPYTLDVLIVVHTIYLMFSCIITNPESFNSWTRTYLMPAAAYFFGKYLLSRGDWFRRAVGLLIPITLYMGLTAVAEHFHWNALIWPKWILTKEHEFVNRSVGIFVQPGVLGTFLGMVMPFHFYFHVHSRSALRRWLHLGGIVVCFIGLYFTYTRGSYLATIAGVAALAFSRPAFRRRVLLYGAVVACVAVLGFLNVERDPVLQKRLKNENTITGRLNVMATTYRIWQDKPVFGVGFLRYRDVREDYRSTITVPIYGMIKATHDERSVPHDIYIGILAEEGLVGGIVQFWIYFLIIRTVVILYNSGRRRGADEATDFVGAVVASMVCYFVGGWAFDYRYFETLNSHFYLYAGVLVGWRARAMGRVASVVDGSPAADRDGYLA